MAEPDVLYISSIDWSFLWQVHQEIAIRLARRGQRVFYVENSGVRTPGVADAARVAARLGSWVRARPTHGFRPVASAPDIAAARITVHPPLVLPPFAGVAARAVNRAVLLPHLLARARAAGLGDERLLFTFLPTDTALDLIALARTPQSRVVYYCLADFERLTDRPDRLRATEDELVRSADVVLVNSPHMAARLGRLRPDVHLFPPGIDLAAFPVHDAIVDTGDQQLLAGLPRPIVGYVGGLHRLVDFELLLALARSRPAWSFLLVGPRLCDGAALAALAALPNVHLIGERAHERLAGLIAACDVCLCPYLVAPSTESVMPVKVNEYLAMGRRVVATALPPMRELAARTGVVDVAPSEPVAFARAIEFALADDGGQLAAGQRRAAAEAVDWDQQFARMQALIAAAWAAPRRAARL